MLLTFGNQVISIVFGIWMEDSFGLQLEQLGAASIVIGLAGLTGVGCAILFTDRLGKRRAIGLGILLNSTICMLLPLLRSQLWTSLVMLFIFYLSFEFSITSLLPLLTTLSVKARGVYMAATIAAFSLGDALGALVGPLLIRTGLAANAVGTVVINLVGLLLLVLFIRPLNIEQQNVDQLVELSE
jgi:predicted MFS family arabinose efflux permease